MITTCGNDESEVQYCTTLDKTTSINQNLEQLSSEFVVISC